jgi:hypothetical protein
MREIPLTQNRVALVDDEDYAWLVAMGKWHAHFPGFTHGFYAKRMAMWNGTTRRALRMHRLVLERMIGRELSCSEKCDHRDGNKANNQRSNLRIATHSQNIANAPKRAGCSSNFKGVTWNSSRRKWRAQIRVNNALFYLGRFSDELAAARAYDVAAIAHHGEFARCNSAQLGSDE